MNNAFRLSGMGSETLITPFNAAGEIDFPALERLVLKIKSTPIEFIAVNGSASEAALLSPEECLRSLEFVAEINNNEKRLIGGLPGGNTRSCVSQIVSFTERTPCSAILCHEPLPRARTTSGYLGHFRSLAQASALPIIVEHNQSSIPDVSEALVELAMDPNVCGIVDATGDVALNGELIRKKTPDNFFVLTSRDVMMLPLMALGIDGAVSTIANAFPQECSEMMGQMAFGNPFQDAQKRTTPGSVAANFGTGRRRLASRPSSTTSIGWKIWYVCRTRWYRKRPARHIYKELAALPQQMVENAMQ